MINEFKFKEFLLSEQTYDLATKIGDVLTALQNLTDPTFKIGSKEKVSSIKLIASSIREEMEEKNWPEEQKKYIEKLQDIGVALEKILDGKESEEILSNLILGLQEVLKQMEAPFNTLVPTEPSATTNKQIAPPAEEIPNIEEPQKTASAESPPEAEDVENLDQGRPPNNAPGIDQNLGATPLGGSSGPMLGI